MSMIYLTIRYSACLALLLMALSGSASAQVTANPVVQGAAAAPVSQPIGPDTTTPGPGDADCIYTITATAGLHGWISPAGVTKVGIGKSVRYTITPAAGYHVADVRVDGKSVGAVRTYTFSNVRGNHTIYASFAINTLTITAGAGPNGSIDPAGVTKVTYGGSQAYVIAPATGYRVADVLVDGHSVGAVTLYNFTNVTVNHTITASFSAGSFSITSTAGPNGFIEPAGVTPVVSGGSQSYAITAATGYHVAGVLVDGGAVGAVAGYTFTNVTNDHAIGAAFAIDTFTITATAGEHGSINPPGSTTVNYGDSLGYAIAPSGGYRVDSVFIDGVFAGAVSGYTFRNVTAGHTIRASFVVSQLTITASAGLHGSIAPSGVIAVNFGDSLAFAMTSTTGYHVADVLVDGGSVGATAGYTFRDVTTSHAISAAFAIDTFTVTVTGGGAHGSISPSGSTTVTYGDSLVCTITPDTGYHIVDVLVDGGSVGAVGTYTFRELQGSHTISATFAGDAFHIVSTAGANGSIAPAGDSLVAFGDSLAFTITPATRYRVDSVIVDGARVDSLTHYTFYSISASHSIRATFTLDSVTVTVFMEAGWNLVAVPVVPPDFTASVLFPGAVRNRFYQYTGVNYEAVTTLRNGRGYWVFYLAPQAIEITGLPIITTSDTAATAYQWNIIGSVTQSVPLDHFTTEPGNMRFGPRIFQYRGAAYSVATILDAGKGYWVVVKAPCTLTVSE